MKPFLPVFIFLFFLIQCKLKPSADQKESSTKWNDVEKLTENKGNTIETRFKLPNGFYRDSVGNNSFEKYLRTLPLKAAGAKVHLYNGKLKGNDYVYAAVVDMEIGNKDLQQCADAVIRLRSEYLFSQKKYNEIHFNLTNGFRVDYSKWINGYRVIVKGNKTSWKKTAIPSNNYQAFRNYLDFVFNYAGSLSLSKELVKTDYKNIRIGDVLIHGGSPGHAVLVVDMATNRVTREKIFLIVQSYMPAQEIQVLNNLENESISPWYKADIKKEIIETAEWQFYSNEFKRFKSR